MATNKLRISMLATACNKMAENMTKNSFYKKITNCYLKETQLCMCAIDICIQFKKLILYQHG
jgi:hypothetical protein